MYPEPGNRRERGVVSYAPKTRREGKESRSPGADTLPIWTRWHLFGNIKRRPARPDTFVLDRENGKVFRIHIVELGFVRDGECTAAEILLPKRVYNGRERNVYNRYFVNKEISMS